MTATEKDTTPARPTSRRAALRRLGLGGAATAGAAASVLVAARPAGAATGDPLALGRTTNGAGATTSAAYTGTATDVHAFTFADNSGAVPRTNGTAVVVGHATTLDAGVQGSALLRGAAGVGGFSTGVNGVGVRAVATGTGGTGVSATGGSVAVAATMPAAEDNAAVVVDGARRGLVTSPTTTFPLSLSPGAQTGPPTVAAVVGDVAVDAAGTVWFCTVAGTPGTFVRLGGTGGAGQFTPMAPVRAYDSRRAGAVPSRLASGTYRTISVARGLDQPAGSTLVPPGATAVAMNLAVTSTEGSGWLSVQPGDVATPVGASINWWGPGQTLSNWTVAKLDGARQLRIFGLGSGATHVVVDVTGYYL
jgi:hypothetical protein